MIWTDNFLSSFAQNKPNFGIVVGEIWIWRIWRVISKFILKSTFFENHTMQVNQLNDKEFCREFIRASNAIEGLYLSDDDKKFMDNIDPNISNEDFKELILNRLKIKSNANQKILHSTK